MVNYSSGLEKGTEIVKRSDFSLKRKTILKDDVEVLPMWFGRRLSDDSDFEAFQMALFMYRSFPMYPPFVIPDANEMKDPDPKLLRPMARDLKVVLDGIKNPLVVFVVTTANAAEHPWLDQFPKNLQEYRQQYNKRDDTFIYKIMMGGYFSKIERSYTEQRFWDSELIAYELGGSYLYFDTDAPTAGSRRVVDFMSRILGKDLPGEEFPDYSREEIQKIAWNINRENFNAFSIKMGAVPKYAIGENGRPVFPF